MRIFGGIDELRQAKGSEIGSSDWLVIEQRDVDRFAEATGDRQWIHVDQERAVSGPFGTTIAHGFLTLSLLTVLIGQVYRIDGVRMGVNYGFDRVRFTSPVPVGARVRAQVGLIDVADIPGGAVQVTTKVIVGLEGSDRPALVAEWLTRLYT
jgi:acyl dehydratase